MRLSPEQGFGEAEFRRERSSCDKSIKTEDLLIGTRLRWVSELEMQGKELMATGSEGRSFPRLAIRKGFGVKSGSSKLPFSADLLKELSFMDMVELGMAEAD